MIKMSILHINNEDLLYKSFCRIIDRLSTSLHTVGYQSFNSEVHHWPTARIPIIKF